MKICTKKRIYLKVPIESSLFHLIFKLIDEFRTRRCKLPREGFVAGLVREALVLQATDRIQRTWGVGVINLIDPGI
jgi:hypothetical protein